MKDKIIDSLKIHKSLSKTGILKYTRIHLYKLDPVLIEMLDEGIIKKTKVFSYTHYRLIEDKEVNEDGNECEESREE